VTVGDGVIAFLAAFCGGWIAARVAALAMLGINKMKAERERKARLAQWRQQQ
jgi:hypothetical protein